MQNAHYSKLTIVSIMVIGCITGLVILWYKLFVDPNIIFLVPEKKAEWIKYDKPLEIVARLNAKQNTAFRKSITLDQPVSRASIHLKALRYYSVYFDNKLILQSPPSKLSTLVDWKKAVTVEITDISAGEHELLIVIMNYNGPPLLLAWSDELNVYSDESWLSSQVANENNWQTSRLAKTKEVLAYTKSFTPSYIAFINKFPLIIILLAIPFLYYLLNKRTSLGARIGNYSGHAIDITRYSLFLLWVVLSVFSLVNHPLSGGDYQHHLAYIQYIVDNFALPLATDGMEMFQSPLYYIVSAVFLKITSVFFQFDTALQMLKVIPLLCGLAIIEINYRIVKKVFKDNTHLQFMGVVFGALIPMNLHMSQYIANEPMAAVFSALSIYLVADFLLDPEQALHKKKQYWLGLTLGAALLSKASAILLVLLCVTALLLSILSQNESLKKSLIACSRVLAMIFLVAGWYYIRNWVYLGKPFVGGWDPANGFFWWQDPGYRVMEHFTSFGLAFFYPIYANTAGFWDAIYAQLWTDAGLGGVITSEENTRWNLSFMLALPLLSIVPTVAILTGIISTGFKNNAHFRVILFSSACVALFVLALAYMFILAPMHSQGRSTYMLGLIPCFSILFVKGYEYLGKKPNVRRLLFGLFLCWAVFSYCSFIPLTSPGDM